MEPGGDSRIKLDVSDALQMLRILSRQLSAPEKADLLGQLKAHLLDQSIGNEYKRIAWLKNLFCEVPLLDMELDSDKAISLFTFLLNNLYPDIKGYFSQNVRIPFLMTVELVISQLRELLADSQCQCNKLYRLQAMTMSRLGAELTFTGDHDAAMKKLLSAMEIMKRLVVDEPNESKSQRTLSNIYQNLGHLEKDVSSTAAFKWFEKSAETRKQLLELEPGNPLNMDLLATSYCMMGDIEEHGNENDDGSGGTQWFLKTYKLSRRVIAIKPEDEDYQFSLSMICERLGCLRLRQNKPEQALKWFTKSYSITHQHYEANLNSRQKIDTYWVACNWLGRTYSALNDVASSRDWFFKALEVAERLYALDHNNIRYCGILAMACLKLADELESSYPETAMKYFSRSLKLTDSRIREGLRSIDYCNISIAALEGLQRTSMGHTSPDSLTCQKNRLTELQKMLDQISC
ncbi:MAG: tetratricopeptide repeat protein [Desulfuromonadaceae bacterium]|nr:tetratricopeptide repeat protein [Desulfuromonadaceae bacterium]